MCAKKKKSYKALSCECYTQTMAPFPNSSSFEVSFLNPYRKNCGQNEVYPNVYTPIQYRRIKTHFLILKIFFLLLKSIGPVKNQHGNCIFCKRKKGGAYFFSSTHIIKKKNKNRFSNQDTKEKLCRPPIEGSVHSREQNLWQNFCKNRKQVL